MADDSEGSSGGKSKEEVALTLLQFVANAENKALRGVGGERTDRSWILSTYAECLRVVRTARALEHEPR